MDGPACEHYQRWGLIQICILEYFWKESLSRDGSRLGVLDQIFEKYQISLMPKGRNQFDVLKNIRNYQHIPEQRDVCSPVRVLSKPVITQQQRIFVWSRI